MNNIQAYNAIAKSKKVSELFLGTFDINWDFAKIGYTAVCTEALPLTVMERMVCGIVNLDGRVYLGDLARIMGCLLYTSPSPRDVEESRMPSSA